MLFGHQNDNTDQATPTAVPAGDGVNPLAIDPETGASLPTAPPPPPPSASITASGPTSILNQPAPSTDEPVASAAPTLPSLDLVNSAPTTTAPEPVFPDSPSPAADEPAIDTTPPSEPAPATASNDSVAADDLLTLKQEALSQLGPLVDQLEQTPEEKFRTTMMLIQSTDDPTRIPSAYEAAQAITDEKIRAQALLDVINEINYFTHKSAE